MAIRIDKIIKRFPTGSTPVLKQISLEIGNDDFVALTGRSGSGKSTLLYIMSSLDVPTSGSVEIDGHNIQTMDEAALHDFRNQHLGFIFQFHYLLPELTALENVLLPARRTRQHETRRDYAVHLLQQFGLGEKIDRFATQLSGGEQQRVAIARALVMRPKYIFADEPTGNLDSANGDRVMEILRQAHTEDHTCVIYVTHDPDYAAQAKRRITLVDGEVAAGA